MKGRKTRVRLLLAAGSEDTGLHPGPWAALPMALGARLWGVLWPMGY